MDTIPHLPEEPSTPLPALPPPPPGPPAEGAVADAALAPPPPPYVVIPAPAPPPPVYRSALPPPPAAGPAGLAIAGLESGVLGVLLMFVWFALDSLVENQYWWAMLNLWGSALYGNVVFRMTLGKASLAGGALQLFLGGVAGAVFGLAIGRIRRFGLVVAAALAAGVAWYGILEIGILPALNPLIGRMTPQPATLLAHLLYATVLTRIPRRGEALEAAWREAL